MPVIESNGNHNNLHSPLTAACSFRSIRKVGTVYICPSPLSIPSPLSLPSPLSMPLSVSVSVTDSPLLIDNETYFDKNESKSNKMNQNEIK